MYAKYQAVPADIMLIEHNFRLLKGQRQGPALEQYDHFGQLEPFTWRHWGGERGTHCCSQHLAQ